MCHRLKTSNCPNIDHTHYDVIKQETNKDKLMDHNIIYNTHLVVKQETDMSNQTIDKPHSDRVKQMTDISNKTIDNRDPCDNIEFKQETDMSNQTIDKHLDRVKHVIDTSNKSIDNCDNIKVKQEVDVSNNIINNNRCDIKEEIAADDNSDCNNFDATDFEMVKLEPYNSTIDKSPAECDNVVKLELDMPSNTIDNSCSSSNYDNNYNSTENREELIIPDIYHNLETSSKLKHDKETANFVWDPDEETRPNNGIPDSPASSTLSLKDLLCQKRKMLCSDDDSKSNGKTQTHKDNGDIESQPASPQLLIESKSTKRTKYISLTAVQKQEIIEYHKRVKETWPSSEYPYKTKMVKRTAAFFSIPSRSVYKVLKEFKTFGKVTAPKKERVKVSDKLNESQKMAILNIVDSFGESPSFKDIFEAVNDNDRLPNFKKTTFQKILKRLRTCGVDWSDKSYPK